MTIPDPSKLYPRAKDRQTIDALLELRWWDWPLEKLSESLRSIQQGDLEVLRQKP